MDEESLITRSPVTIAVFGGGGGTGSTLIQMAQEADFISQIYCIDNDDLRVRQAMNGWANTKKIQFRTADFRTMSQTQKNSIRGSSVIVNAATFEDEANVVIMQIAQEINANYIDLASENNFFPPEEWSFHEPFKKQGLIGMFNWGVGPGLTNLIARHLTEGLENCKVRIFVCEDTVTSLKKLFLWNPRSALNEATSPVPRYFGFNNTESLLRKAFSDPEDFIFPGIGKIRCYLANENEGVTLGTLPTMFRVQTKVGGSDVERLLQAIRKIGNDPSSHDFKNRLRKLIKSLRTPTPARIIELIKTGRLKESTIAISVDIVGIDPKTEEEVCTSAHWKGPTLAEVQKKFPGKTPVQIATAFMAFQAIDRMFKSNSILPGVWPPEKLQKADREIIFERLKHADIPVLGLN